MSLSLVALAALAVATTIAFKFLVEKNKQLNDQVTFVDKVNIDLDFTVRALKQDIDRLKTQIRFMEERSQKVENEWGKCHEKH